MHPEVRAGRDDTVPPTGRRPKPLAVLAAAVVWFLVGAVWYTPLLFGNLWMELRGLDPAAIGQVPPWTIPVELIRCLVVVYVLAHLVVRLRVSDWRAALRLGFLVWLGFPATLLVGSVIWDNVPWTLAAIHAGDWLVQGLLVPMILAAWHRHGGAGAPAPRPSSATATRAPRAVEGETQVRELGVGDEALRPV
jgi:hypothetical protein